MTAVINERLWPIICSAVYGLLNQMLSRLWLAQSDAQPSMACPISRLKARPIQHTAIYSLPNQVPSPL